MTFIRSLLFAPANRPELLKKFPRCAADAFVIDLEDGTPEYEKAAARHELPAIVGHLRDSRLQGLLLVRINEAASAHADADLEVALGADIDGVVIPKLGAVPELQRIGAALAAADRTGLLPREERGGGPLIVVGIIESIAGVMNAHAIATADPRLRALCFGAEDFIAEMGGRRTGEGLEVLYARSRVVLAATAAGVFPIDQAVVNIRDDEAYRHDAVVGRDLGYGGKICLLPRQAELANEVFSPSAAEIESSRRLVAAYEAARAQGRAVIDYEGRMIDPPLLKHAQTVLALASRVQRTS